MRPPVLVIGAVRAVRPTDRVARNCLAVSKATPPGIPGGAKAICNVCLLAELFCLSGSGGAYACAAAALDALVGIDNVNVASRDSFYRALAGTCAACDTNILINLVSHFLEFLVVVENFANILLILQQ